MSNWQNILESIFAAPSIILEQITNGWQQFWRETDDLAKNGEFDEDDIAE